MILDDLDIMMYQDALSNKELIHNRLGGDLSLPLPLCSPLPLPLPLSAASHPACGEALGNTIGVVVFEVMVNIW